MAVLSATRLEYPFTLKKIRRLKPGQLVMLSGHLFACRDRVHKYVFEGGKLPVSLEDGAIYHCGPAVIRKEGAWVVRAAGPTTSIRHEAYMPRLIEERQVRVIVGKGGMGERTRKACAAFGCVYLQAVGGAAQNLAEKVKKTGSVHFLEEFGPSEALWDFVVKDFPAIVAIDARGRSLYRRIEASSRRTLLSLLRGSPFRG